MPQGVVLGQEQVNYADESKRDLLKGYFQVLHKGAFRYYVSAFGGVGGLSRNADTADAGEGVGGVSDEMLTLLILGSGGVEKSWLRAEIKRK